MSSWLLATIWTFCTAATPEAEPRPVQRVALHMRVVGNEAHLVDEDRLEESILSGRRPSSVDLIAEKSLFETLPPEDCVERACIANAFSESGVDVVLLVLVNLTTDPTIVATEAFATRGDLTFGKSIERTERVEANIAATVREQSESILARLPQPQPVQVEKAAAPQKPDDDLPTWVWVVGIGAALVAGAAAIFIISSKPDQCLCVPGPNVECAPDC